jgi:hypothetical protein
MFLDLFRSLEVQSNHRWRSKVLGRGCYPIPKDKQGVEEPTDLRACPKKG